MSRRFPGPDHGELSDFTTQPNGDVVVSTTNIENDCAYTALITYAELQGMAEASRVARETAEAAERAKHETVDHFYR
jgi:hypothetical protein